MDQDVAISLKNVSMTFVLNREKVDNLKEYVIKLATRKIQYNTFEALKDINIEVKKGERLAILGFNGAGKSTLLKTIVGVYKPTSGTVEKQGVIAPLLELGAGFSPEYTGRENIFLYGAILGYSRKYLEERYDEIVEFSELGKFIDVPVKNYSSGMKSRLGFSIATAVDPDVLILDEVLSVGDARFRSKSLKKIQSLFEKGVTVLFVSHNIDQVRAICDSAILLDHGEIIARGDVDEVSAIYQKMTASAKREKDDYKKQEKAVFNKALREKKLKADEAEQYVQYAFTNEDKEEFDAIKQAVPALENIKENGSMTRGDFVSMLYQCEGSPYDTENPCVDEPFSDVKDKSLPYYNVACWAYDNGLAVQHVFNANGILTRTAAFTLAYRYAANVLNNKKKPKTKDVTAISDWQDVSVWSQKPFDWAYNNNLVHLTKDEKLNPNGLFFGIQLGKLMAGMPKKIEKDK